MGADDLLCSRNARPQKALVERAQWKINQPPSLKRERASLKGSPVASFDARREGYEVERGTFLLDLMRTYCVELLGAMISRSSISNTNVAPGLIRGGRPLSR